MIRWQRILDLRFVAAHFGGWSEWDGRRISGLKMSGLILPPRCFCSAAKSREMIESLGEDRFMFCRIIYVEAPDELDACALELPDRRRREKYCTEIRAVFSIYKISGLLMRGVNGCGILKTIDFL
jgi:hypothetical protein